MNTILQKRIEEAAEKIVCSVQCAYFDLDKTCCCYEKKFCMKTAEEILQNQWISVEEALPEEVQEGFCDDKFVLYCGEYPATASYDHKRKKWYYGDYEILGVTHWMPIPQIEGGEK